MLDDLRNAYRLRWRRREFLWRSWRARHALTPRKVRVPGTGILCFSCIRNEAERLPYFLTHYRNLGVRHFLFVVNDSTDDSAAFLAGQPDTSVWETKQSYKQARFGMDWLGWLLGRFGSGRWCLTVDADELLIYPHWRDRPLQDLVAHLDAEDRQSFGALTVDLYPRERLSAAADAENPLDALEWFDPGPYRQSTQRHLGVDLFQGGVRDRLLFSSAPSRAPTMNKAPLVKWYWRYAYMNSTHSLLPPRLNDVFSLPDQGVLSGALLHTKFLPSIVPRSAEEKERQQHFARSEAHNAYYDALAADPVLWSADHSVRFEDWRQLASMGLLGTGAWGEAVAR
ncbi:MAG: glycosyltransferase family 2 protein [Pseudomonadota bacterium]